jgi:arylsulfatase A-like enzyme
MKPISRLFAMACLMSWCGCAGNPEPPRPNVVIITVDTLRADRMPFYGSPQNTAPFLDEFARRSLVFENAWTPTSWTLPSAVSVITSVHPFQHGVNSYAGLELEPDEEPIPINVIPEDIETLAETLQQAGYRTYGIASNILVGSEIDFDRGFDRFAKLPDRDADAVNAVATSWSEEILQGGPFFFYLHYFDPHDRFHTRAPWFEAGRTSEETGWSEEFSREAVDPDQLDWFMTRLERLPDGFEGRKAGDLTMSEVGQLLAWSKAAYDSEIGFVDSRIREMVELFDMENAIVVFLADHGEEFYEHRHLTHGQNLYHETMRVPFFLHLPGEDAQPGRVTSHVSTLDVAPTLRRLLRLPASSQDQGQDLLADAARQPVIGVLEGKSGHQEIDIDLRSIVVDNHRLIKQSDGLVEPYDLANDPLERINLAKKLPEVAARLIQQLDQIEQSAPRYTLKTRIPPPNRTNLSI